MAIKNDWMLDPATERMVNIYINLFLIGVGVIVLPTGLVLYSRARISQDPVRKNWDEKIMLFGGSAIILGLALLARTL